MGLLTFAINVTLVHPVVAGHGPTLFLDWQASSLKLVETKRFKSGVIALRYRRVTPRFLTRPQK
jgi:hypothetical protein